MAVDSRLVLGLKIVVLAVRIEVGEDETKVI